MLILTRRVGESLIIGDDIVISVIEVRGDAVRIGVQAPRSVSVHREEVYRELQAANRQAAASSDEAIGKLLADRGPRREPKAADDAQNSAAAPDTPKPGPARK